MEPANGVHASGDHQHIRLACQACQRKKIKCSRNYPCTECSRSSLQCVPSQRKPRSRHVKTAIDSELKNRISKLESLVESLSGDVGSSCAPPPPPSTAAVAPLGEASPAITTPGSNDAPSPAVGKYIGSHFWTTLTSEVQALREVLEEDQDDDEPDVEYPSNVPNGGATAALEYDFILCPPGAVYIMPGALQEPSPQQQSLLYEAFIGNVDPMFKITHVPSLRASLEQGVPYLGQAVDGAPMKALKAALWYSALVSLSGKDECEAIFAQSRATLLIQYRRTLDVLLSQADLINTTELVTLQAFLIYLASTRMVDPSRRIWTLAALLVRIARAMNLHTETPGRTIYETEMRRRLWHQIRFFEIFTAMDRGTAPLIVCHDFDTPLPSNVNDVDFNEASTIIISHETGLTDMSLARLTQEATAITQRLTTPEIAHAGCTWQSRLDIAHAFGKDAQRNYVQYCDLSDPFQRLVAGIAKSVSAGMVLRAIRPMSRHIASIPPRVDSPYVLQIATEALRANENFYADKETRRWRWLIWVQWHALAVALAGLCSIRGTPLADEAWLYTEKVYTRHSQYVADARNGMLWRPIQKLHKRASAFREEGLIAERAVLPEMAGLAVQAPYNISAPQMMQPALPVDSYMNMGIDDGLGGFTDQAGGLQPATDMTSWVDWEHIMDDFSDINVMDMDMLFGAQTAIDEQSWPLI